jgi:hypothetical protein
VFRTLTISNCGQRFLLANVTPLITAATKDENEAAVHHRQWTLATAVWFVRHPWAGILAMGLFSFLFLLQGAWRSWPLPSNMDEFSALLGADTFYRGRLANPTPPLWEHFETLHVIFEPTYASKYPPAPALALALGRHIFGDPIWAVWLSTTLACAAITWMLMAWVPFRWAMLGAFFAVLHPLVVSWGRFYLCCNLGVIGAALLLGSAKRLLRRCTYARGICVGSGIGLLLNVRPYEGAVLSAGVALWLLASVMRKQTFSLRILVPSILPILLLTIAAMGYYNWRVTGSALKMPYAVHAEQYDSAPPFWFQKAHPKWAYRHANLLDFHVWEMNTYLDMQDSKLRMQALAQRLKVILFWFFDLSMIALLWILAAIRRKSLRPIFFLSALMLAAFMLTTWLNSNYISVAIPLYFILLTECLRRVAHSRLPRTKLLVGPLLIAGLVLGTTAWALQDLQPFDLNDSNYGYVRARIIANLHARGGRHLIFVRYSPQHPRAEEWIYNEADIPNAPIIWAHDMGRQANEALIRQYPERQLWQFDADALPKNLLPMTAEIESANRQ